MNAATLCKAMPGLSYARSSQLVNGCNAAMLVGNITNVRRAAMFLAQIGHESVSLRYKQEIQPPPGATYPPYIGRTFIQVTWYYNYAAFGKWCARKNLLGDWRQFIDHPATLAADRWAWLGAIWYWTVQAPGLNAMADRGDIYGCTKAINGGLNGFSDRQYRYQRCLKLGAAILPTKTRTTTTVKHGAPPHKPPKAGYANYRVRAGDTLSSIAQHYHNPRITVQSLSRLNHLANPNQIREGQVLKIG